jgi:hypothetical protein
MNQVKLNEVKPGDYVMRKPDSKTVFVKGAYDKGSKAFSLTDTEDMNREIFLKSSTLVYIGFTY